MGKYMELVRKFEAKRQAEGRMEPRREAGPSSQPGKSPSIPDLKEAYCHTAEALAEDCFALDPHWLIDHHPNLWKRLVWLDEQAAAVEREGKSEENYCSVLDRIVETVKEARRLYEASQIPSSMEQ